MSESAPLCEKLEWDSTFFGLSIGRVRPQRLDPERCAEALDWARAEQIRCLYFLSQADDEDTRTMLAESGFLRVDERVTLELPSIRDGVTTPADARGSRSEDVPALREIAAISHHDSRFYNDGGFDRAKCDDFYRVWIEKSCQGWADHVVVVERDSTAVGYLTVHLKSPESATLGLLGVLPSLRRQGLGNQLLDGALAWIATQRPGAHVSLATQGRNSKSQGFFQNAGFRTVGASVWYHRWFPANGDSTR